MSSQIVPPKTEAEILARLIQAREQELAPEVARYLLGFAFDTSDIERMNALAEQAQQGKLTNEGQAELDSYLHVSDLLTVMQSKARQFLKHNEPNSR